MTTLKENEIKELQNILKERNINCLVHFTKLSNLDSILKHGLMPRNELENKGIPFNYNDKMRLDKTNAICTSIEFPNYKMFYKYRNADSNNKWAVIKINASVLYELDCAYCFSNATSNLMSSIPLNKRKTLDSFKTLFYDTCGISRLTLNIPDNYTTNPQAEVLVMECIPTYYFKGIGFEDELLRLSYSIADINISNIPFSHVEEFFQPRCDYTYWKGNYISTKTQYMINHDIYTHETKIWR